MAKETNKSVFATLNAVNVNDHAEKKENLTYLSWVWAWAEVKSRYPSANYEVKHWDGKPYLYDETLGYMVETAVSIEGETMTMWLPVMDSKNKAQKSTEYSYKTKYGEKTVEAATMFDINTAIMRCLVKNIAMFGLGLYIYADEDLPEDAKREISEKERETEEAFNIVKPEIKTAPTLEHLQQIHRENSALHNYAPYKTEMNKRFKELQAK